MVNSEVSRQAKHERRRKARGDVKYAFWIPKDKADLLERISQRTGRSRADVILQLVDEHLDSEEAA